MVIHNSLNLPYPIPATLGGTGVANLISSTVTIGGPVTFTGAYPFAATLTGSTTVTFPVSGTLATTTQLANYLPLAGGAMTGNLILNANATLSLQAVTLQQVNSLITSVSITGTANQITVSGTSPNFTLSFPSVLHTVNGTTLDDGSGNISTSGGIIVGTNVAITGLTVSKPVKTNGTKQLVSAAIDLTTDITNTLPIANGGTNNTSFSPNGLLIGGAGAPIASGTIQEVTPPGFYKVLCSDAIGGVSWQTTIPILAQDAITNLGTIGTGIWQGSVIQPTWGGTGVNNGSNTLTLAGSLSTIGAYTTALTMTGPTTLTLPTTGTLATTTQLANYLPLAGGTMTGNLILNADATSAMQAVTYEQLQAVSAGLDIKQACYAATVGTTLTVTYSNGTSGVGATLTNAGTQAVFTLDSLTPAVNSRILVKDQTSSFQNGIYTVTNVGSVSTNWVLTRSTDYNTTSEIFPGNLLVIDNGTLNTGTGWLQTATVNTIGTDAISFSAFNLMQAGTGLTRTGNTISLTSPVALNLGGTNAALTASNGGIFYSTASAGAILSATATANQLLMSGASAAPIWSTTTYPTTNAINTLLYASSANVMSALATANNGVLITSGTGVPSISSTLPSAVQTNITIAESQVTNLTTDLASKLSLSGGTMTGNLILNANATSSLQAVPLQQLTSVASGYLSLTGGTLTGSIAGTSATFSGLITANGSLTIPYGAGNALNFTNGVGTGFVKYDTTNGFQFFDNSTGTYVNAFGVSGARSYLAVPLSATSASFSGNITSSAGLSLTFDNIVSNAANSLRIGAPNGYSIYVGHDVATTYVSVGAGCTNAQLLVQNNGNNVLYNNFDNSLHSLHNTLDNGSGAASFSGPVSLPGNATSSLQAVPLQQLASIATATNIAAHTYAGGF
jgi:hypothetical protein